MRRTHLLVAFAFLVFGGVIAGCSSENSNIQPEPRYPMARGAATGSGLMSSSFSSASSSPSFGSHPNVIEPAPSTLPPHAVSVASIVVRPDVVHVPFALHTVVDEPDLGVHMLERAIAGLEPRFAEIVPKGSLTLKMRGTTLEPAPRASKVAKKKAKEGEAAEPPREPIAVTLHGTFDIALAPTQSYWDRSHEIARVRALTDRIMAAGQSDNAPFTSSFGPIEARVHDPEAHRATLVEKWGARRRQLAKEAKSADAVLAAETCKPPGTVTEKVISLEEVELGLPVECGSQERTGASTAPKPL